MADTLAGVSALIVSKLEGLVNGSDPLIDEVRDYAGGEKANYPLAEVLPTGGVTVRRIDTGRNERVFNFEVNLYQEQSEGGKGAEASTDAIKVVCDAILTAFDTDKDFGKEVENVIISRMAFDYAPASGPKLVATFTVECAIIVPNV